MIHLWSSICFLFFLIQGSLCRIFMQELKEACGDTDKCADSELNRHLAEVSFMPTTELALNAYCPAATKVLWCIIDECANENLYGSSVISNQSADVMRTLFNAVYIVSEICITGTELRQSYLSGMTCFKDILDDGETNIGCQQEGSRAYEKYMHSFDHLVQRTPEEIESEKRCVSVAYSLPCIVDATRDKCGEDASDMILSILKRVDALNWLCTDSHVRFLQTRFLDFLIMERVKKDKYASFFNSQILEDLEEDK